MLTRTAKIYFHDEYKNTAYLIAENVPLFSVVSQIAQGMQGYVDEEQFENHNGSTNIPEP